MYLFCLDCPVRCVPQIQRGVFPSLEILRGAVPSQTWRFSFSGYGARGPSSDMASLRLPAFARVDRANLRPAEVLDKGWFAVTHCPSKQDVGRTDPSPPPLT